jgi:glycosyltransferase involved in cell wall biosynthesis
MLSKYVLITPVKNEESFIPRSLETIVKQEIKPAQWIIVDDNSTDNTAEIIKEYCLRYKFIKYVKNDNSGRRNFASKVYAINIGINSLDIDNYDYIGVLDADITLEPNYYSDLLNELNMDSKIGIAGGKIIDYVGGKKYPDPSSPYSIKGAIQFFRKKCFDELGGFLPLKYGGEDAIACYMARVKGWQLKHYENLNVYHHRFNGTASESALQILFRFGRGEYHMGYLPIFSLVKSFKIIFQKPYIIGTLAKLSGFFSAKFKREEIIVPVDVVKFLRREQKNRIRSFGNI